MTKQLWASPLTGYRRTGTRVTEIRLMFERDVTVRSVYEPLRACPAEANAAEMAGLLNERGFDVAGVKETDSDAIKRFVTAESLRGGGQVGDRGQPIGV